MNVYPEDLEAALRRQSEVKDCVVIALPEKEMPSLALSSFRRNAVLIPRRW